jgi:hypothetical protein
MSLELIVRHALSELELDQPQIDEDLLDTLSATDISSILETLSFNLKINPPLLTKDFNKVSILTLCEKISSNVLIKQ